MQHPDEGTIHAWLDGALSAEEAERLEAHVAGCESCAEAVAEARGLVAASSRILGALDTVPGHVVPPSEYSSETTPLVPSRRRWWSSPTLRAAAAVLLVAGVGYGVFRGEVPSREADRDQAAFRGTPRSVIAPSMEQQGTSIASVNPESNAMDASASFQAGDVAHPAGEPAESAPLASPRAPEVAGRAASAQGAGAPAAAEPAPPGEVSALERRAEAPAAGVAGDLPRQPLVPDTMRREILRYAVPHEVGKVAEEAAAPAPPPAARARTAAHGAVAAARTPAPSPAVQAAPSPARALGEAATMTEDTTMVLEVVSERADTNVLGVLRTVVYRVRPGIDVTHQSFVRRFPRIGGAREQRDSAGAGDVSGERTHLRLDMDRVQAIHWTDEAEVYHSLAGPVEQEELIRIRAALRARGGPDAR
jgi:hypothetical protein